MIVYVIPIKSSDLRVPKAIVELDSRFIFNFTGKYHFNDKGKREETYCLKFLSNMEF